MTEKKMEFEDEDQKGKRRYQCFVCGVQHTDFEEYKKHIVENHDEGREYVICPLDHCKAPVRDLRLHYKVKHSYAKLPTVDGPTRALIWKDVGQKGKMKTRKPKFQEGWYESHKARKRLHYRSGWERKVYELLDEWNDVITYDVEVMKFTYFFEGENHTYIPDIFVQFIDGRKEVWEIKPSNQTAMKKNQAKWRACGTECQARGWALNVITETGMDKLKQKVKTQTIVAESAFDPNTMPDD